MGVLHGLAVVGATLAVLGGLPAVEATSCDLLEVFTLLKPLAADEDAVACIAATAYDMLPPTAMPTDDQLELICATDSCVAIFSSLEELGLPDCTINLLGGVNVKEIVDAVVDSCPAVASASGSAFADAATDTEVTNLVSESTTTETSATSDDSSESAAADVEEAAETPAPTTTTTTVISDNSKNCI